MESVNEALATGLTLEQLQQPDGLLTEQTGYPSQYEALLDGYTLAQLETLMEGTY